MEKQVAILITFTEGTDKAVIEAWLKKQQEKACVESVSLSEFDAEITFPVLYLP